MVGKDERRGGEGGGEKRMKLMILLNLVIISSITQRPNDELSGFSSTTT